MNQVDFLKITFSYDPEKERISSLEDAKKTDLSIVYFKMKDQPGFNKFKITRLIQYDAAIEDFKNHFIQGHLRRGSVFNEENFMKEFSPFIKDGKYQRIVFLCEDNCGFNKDIYLDEIIFVRASNGVNFPTVDEWFKAFIEQKELTEKLNQNC